MPASDAHAPLTIRGRRSADQETRWLRIWLHHDSYAVELLRVQEVVRPQPVIQLRGVPASVLGAMNLRGRVVPVIDLGLWLGGARVETDAGARIVVAEHEGELLGVLVSRVEDVMTLSQDRIEPPPASGIGSAISGVARLGPVPTVLVKITALFEPPAPRQDTA